VGGCRGSGGQHSMSSWIGNSSSQKMLRWHLFRFWQLRRRLTAQKPPMSAPPVIRHPIIGVSSGNSPEDIAGGCPVLLSHVTLSSSRRNLDHPKISARGFQFYFLLFSLLPTAPSRQCSQSFSLHREWHSVIFLELVGSWIASCDLEARRGISFYWFH
jgi:hypothetical protein